MKIQVLSVEKNELSILLTLQHFHLKIERLSVFRYPTELMPEDYIT